MSPQAASVRMKPPVFLERLPLKSLDTIASLLLVVLILLGVHPSHTFGQSAEGEIRIFLSDSSGEPLVGTISILSHTAHLNRMTSSTLTGRASFQGLPLANYLVTANSDGFERNEQVISLQTGVPYELTISLTPATVQSTITVIGRPPLIDPEQPGLIQRIGRRELDENRLTSSGRGLIEKIQTLPGWLLEANAVLHPRGSEYDTQYVIDGLPYYDNRSIGFVSGFSPMEFEYIDVYTAGIPAEYGRRLGGVIELHSRRATEPGLHGDYELIRNSFGTYEGAFNEYFLKDPYALTFGVRSGHTDRYLDPPSLENYTNKASYLGSKLRFERDLTEQGRLFLSLHSNRVGFLVPNDLVQHSRQQRQDRRTGELSGQLSFQKSLSPTSALSLRGMRREITAELWSSPVPDVPLISQKRGFSENVLIGSYSLQTEQHVLSAGFDAHNTHVHEAFDITNLHLTLSNQNFNFRDQGKANEIGLYIQDRIHLMGFVIDAGLRFDSYRFLVKDHAFSPRVAAGYYFQGLDLQLRASYDRIFQVPPIENLLLSNASTLPGIKGFEGRLSVPASRANFYEVGLRQGFFDRARLDITHYWRDFENSFDDDVFLNTGIGFPLTFHSANISGTEVRLEMPKLGKVTSTVSYSNMIGFASSPVTGGLFIEGGEAEELRTSTKTFPITQDQRNTLSASLRLEVHPKAWLMTSIRYGSGLPVELEDDSDEYVERLGADYLDSNQYPDEGYDPHLYLIPDVILDKIDFNRGRVRPNFTLDLALGLRLVDSKRFRSEIQIHGGNITNRLNVLNFSGLFSGTAISTGRTVGVRLQVSM